MIFINIWKYQNKKRLTITTISGDVYTGNVVEFTDTGERSDLEEQEDGFTLEIGGRYIEFMQSEIMSIEQA